MATSKRLQAHIEGRNRASHLARGPRTTPRATTPAKVLRLHGLSAGACTAYPQSCACTAYPQRTITELSDRIQLSHRYSYVGRTLEAIEVRAEVLPEWVALFGWDAEAIALAAQQASMLNDVGEAERAHELVESLLEELRYLGTEDQKQMMARVHVAGALLRLGRWEEAEELVLVAREIATQLIAVGGGTPELSSATLELARVRLAQGRRSEARALLEQALGEAGPEATGPVVEMIRGLLRSLGPD